MVPNVELIELLNMATDEIAKLKKIYEIACQRTLDLDVQDLLNEFFRECHDQELRLRELYNREKASRISCGSLEKTGASCALKRKKFL